MIKLGKMTKFYRNQAILSEHLSTGGLDCNNGLTDVPSYLLNESLDFPYKKKLNHKKEVLFADHFTVVRFLGGIIDENIPLSQEKKHKLDLIYKDKYNKFQYRWELLERLRPFIDIYGNEFTIVLDNIPWDLPEEPSLDGYGQVNPPADYDIWKEFIKSMVNELIQRFGFDIVNGWRFRLATEGRINLNTQQFCRHYDITTGIIKSLLPAAKFSPFNMCKVHETEQFHINYYEFAKHCSCGTNSFNGQKGSPLDFLPVSYYSFPAMGKTGINTWTVSPLERTINDYHNFWDNICNIDSKYNSISREIQELGILSNEYGFYTSEQGTRSAAWLFQLLFNMKQFNNINKAWHWHTTDVIEVPNKQTEDCHKILQSNGWLYSILEYTIGSDIYVLDTKVETDEPNFLFKAIAFIGAENNKSYIILSAFNNDRDLFFKGNISVEIPSQLLNIRDTDSLKQVILSNSTDVYYAIRQDLYENSLLDEKFVERPNLLCTINDKTTIPLTDVEGRKYIDQNWKRYEKIITDSLILKPFQGNCVLKSNKYLLNTNIQAPSVIVIQID